MQLKYILAFFSLSLFTTLSAQEVSTTTTNDNSFNQFFNKNIDYQVRANFSIGGTAPLGLPEEIREIKSFNPTLNLGLEANATKWFSDEKKYGIRLGVRVEGKGMKTTAQVKSYLIEVNSNEGPSRGYFTGKVKTHVKNTYLTIPVSFVYAVTDKWNIYGGGYVSAAIDKNFDGTVSDGYLREGAPTGLKVVFEGDAKADYDYSKDVNTFQWGAQVGGEWKMNNHFRLFADATYGINQVLNKDFEEISFSMHNIYLNLGFGYQF